MESEKQYDLLLEEEGDVIIYFRHSSLNLTRYLNFLKDRLTNEKPPKFNEKEINDIVRATGWRIKNQNSQSTDSVDNGTT